MKLLKLPTTTTETIDLSTFTGRTTKAVGRTTISDVEILLPDKIEDDKDDVWQALKYGPMIDFFDAMHSGIKFDKIEFPKDKLILYGVRPTEMSRSAAFEGRVFTCTIDYFEVMP